MKKSGESPAQLVHGVRFRALGLRSHTDIPALKELEEWFDTKEMLGIAKLDPFFERTSKLASRRLKRELERRGTLGGSPLALEMDPSLKRIPTEESDSDLFRSDGSLLLLRSPATMSRRRALCRAARPKGAPLGPGKRSLELAPFERFAVEPPLVWAGQPLSPGVPKAQGDSEAWFLDCRLP